MQRNPKTLFPPQRQRLLMSPTDWFIAADWWNEVGRNDWRARLCQTEGQAWNANFRACPNGWSESLFGYLRYAMVDHWPHFYPTEDGAIRVRIRPYEPYRDERRFIITRHTVCSARPAPADLADYLALNISFDGFSFQELDGVLDELLD